MALAAAIHPVIDPASAAAVPDTIPLNVTNNSDRGEPIYLYNLGTQLSSGDQGWADADGTFHPWPDGGDPPIPAPDASIQGPAPGESMTIQIPRLSGRLYFSYGQKLVFKLAPGGLVQPAVQNPDDPNHDILFNWSEYTLNDDGIWLNSTQVDMFSAPYTVGVTRGDGSPINAGQLQPGGYRAFFDELTAQSGGWADLIRTRADGTVLRALAPGHGIGTGSLPADIMNDYVDRVWEKYGTETLTVTPFADQPDVVYTGQVSGAAMTFMDRSGAEVATFEKPDSDPATFYQDDVTNHYARLVHAQMVDGKAYAFAFDDVGNFESLVHDGDPQAAALTLDPLD